MKKRERDFYQRLRQRITALKKQDEGRNGCLDFLLLAPDIFHLLVKLVRDRDVPVSVKAKLTGAIAYFIAPADLIPEALLGVTAYIDDIALAAFALNTLVNEVSPEIVERHWAGDGNILEIVKKIVSSGDELLGSSIWGKIKRMLR